MLGGEEKEEDPDAAKKEEERQEALSSRRRRGRPNTPRWRLREIRFEKREEAEAEAAAAAEEPAAGSLTRPKQAVPKGCGDEEEEESIMDTVVKYLPGPLQEK
ncbi:hypothetical protein WMY93_005728 [Mugilogobius chulae]|uniref:Uncharacterized protein n=1 Tax=Mugilogobius chulae TaxID=88201 RepID=A0AAW0PHL7_9GOBI